ncbi:MAG: flagellar motor stator protein MotA [Ignavibacteriales bacterium]|nr:flagellar motor stator protein MotA [Ignavibacteriales bacterium]
MNVFIGYVVVIGAVLLGFFLHQGNFYLLLQPSEIIIIVGAAAGSVLIASPPAVLRKIFASIPKAARGQERSKDDYLDLLKSFYDLFILAQRNGLLALEKHVENPEASEVFNRNPTFLNNPTAVAFVCDTLKVMLSGGIPPHEIEELMSVEIETYESEQRPVPNILAKTADSLPGLGIVAAVLGVIVTMASVNEGAIVVGQKVAAALVGTFLGVLLCYGFVSPLATNLEMQMQEDVRFLETIKTCIVSYAKGNPPIVSVEIARRTIVTEQRPSFQELESYLRGRPGI